MGVRDLYAHINLTGVVGAPPTGIVTAGHPAIGARSGRLLSWRPEQGADGSHPNERNDRPASAAPAQQHLLLCGARVKVPKCNQGQGFKDYCGSFITNLAWRL